MISTSDQDRESGTTTAEVRAHAFWWFLTIRPGEITFPYFFTHNGTNHNASHIYEYTAVLDPEKTLSAVILPNTTNSTSGRLHAFALSFYKGIDVHVQSLRPTQNGLCPGDQKRVDVAVDGQFNGTVEAMLNFSKVQKQFSFDNIAIGLEQWTADSKSLVQHEVPQWWYSTRINEHAAADRAGFNAYRLETFGPELNYDDFFANYTASTWNPKEWVDLFAEAGAHTASPGFTQFDHVTSTSHPGIIARNPYTGLEEPYTDRIPVNDFIADLIVPQIDILAYDYGTDIMCTPQRRKWESNQGMDSYSYGYNRATSEEEYMNASTVVHNPIDIISKNGNFLLNIGPRADGSIVQVAVDNLREAGTWIHAHAEAVFNTTLQEPAAGRLEIQAKVPALEGDRVTALTMAGEIGLEWGRREGGGIWIDVTEDVIRADKICWVFKVEHDVGKPC
ncbi:hypothetical protein DL767_006181 [Monosporascus sp. MG133]|nr:hypothetical protein DL767_006181 [Monosporascus sp. MG133]